MGMDKVISIEELHKTYEKQFEEQGYSFVGSIDVCIPFYEMQVYYKYYQMEEISLPEKILCDCINRGVEKEEDLSFVLALNQKLVHKMIERLIVIGMLRITEDRVSFTVKGKELYNHKQRPVITTASRNVYHNLISGQWYDFDKESLVSDNQLFGGVILEPKRLITIEEQQQANELKSFIKSGLKFQEQVEEVSLGRKRELVYRKEILLLYMNDENDMNHLVYDPITKEFDFTVSKYIQRSYSDHQLKEMEPIQKILCEESRLIKGVNNQSSSLRYIQNREIREITKTLFTTVKKSLYIVSPWLGTEDFVLTEEFLSSMESVLKEGIVKIYIMYGYVSEEKLQQLIYKDMLEEKSYQAGKRKYYMKNKEVQTYETAQKLKKRFEPYSNFRIIYRNTHEKILCYDEQYCIIGSYNYLSYDGGEKTNYQGYNFRKEGAVFIDDRDFSRELIQKLL